MSRKWRSPKGVYVTVDEWKNSIKQTQGGSYVSFEMEDLPLTLQPKSIYKQIHPHFIQESHQLSQPAFLVVLNNARVCCNSIITEDDYLMFELSYEYVKHLKQHSIFQKRTLPTLYKYAGEFATLTFSAVNYYHWLFDVLVRFYLLELGNVSYDKILLNNQQCLPYQMETLHLLGIKPEMIYTCHQSSHIRASKVIVPSLVGYYGRMPKWACDYLRNQLLGHSTKIVGYERIFISREKAGKRHVVNEEQILECLRNYGFRKVILEELSVVDQINLFVSAEMIIGPHGAGLANLVFCNPGTKVIELFSPGYVNVMYWRLCNHVNLDYYYVIGQDVNMSGDKAQSTNHISIDIQQLIATLALTSV
jgi:capsular polysaccharide biosynthesis protein